MDLYNHQSSNILSKTISQVSLLAKDTQNKVMTFIHPDLFIEAFKKADTAVNEKGKSTKIEYILYSMKIFQVA